MAGAADDSQVRKARYHKRERGDTIVSFGQLGSLTCDDAVERGQRRKLAAAKQIQFLRMQLQTAAEDRAALQHRLDILEASSKLTAMRVSEVKEQQRPASR